MSQRDVVGLHVRHALPIIVALALAATAGPAAAACLPERVVALDPAVAPLHLGIQSFPTTLALKEREIVLTFDDGPAPATTPRVLAALRAACVHATFFLVGRRTVAAPALARREHEEGHGVGHHSDTHPAFTLRGFDTASAETDIQNGVEADEIAVYGKDATPDHPHEPFFRFPGFADTPALLAWLDTRGIAAFGSDLWAADWLVMSAETATTFDPTAAIARPMPCGAVYCVTTSSSQPKQRKLPSSSDTKSRYDHNHGKRQAATARGPVDRLEMTWPAASSCVAEPFRQMYVNRAATGDHGHDRRGRRPQPSTRRRFASIDSSRSPAATPTLDPSTDRCIDTGGRTESVEADSLESARRRSVPTPPNQPSRWLAQIVTIDFNGGSKPVIAAKGDVDQLPLDGHRPWRSAPRRRVGRRRAIDRPVIPHAAKRAPVPAGS